MPPRRSSRSTEGDTLAQLRGPQGGGIPAGAGADHDYVVGVAHAERQVYLPLATATGAAHVRLRPYASPRMADDDELKRTPLEAEHVALGAKLGPFAGWHMPIEYAGALAEHRGRARARRAVRPHAPGEGRGRRTGRARRCCKGSSRTTSPRSAVGEAQYNLVLNEGGGVIEDLIVYRLDPMRYFVVPNAANTHRVLQILGDAERPKTAAPDVPPGLVLPGRAGAGCSGHRRCAICSPRPADLAFMQCAESEYPPPSRHRDPVGLYGRDRASSCSRIRTSRVDLWRTLVDGGGTVRRGAVRARRPRRLAAGDGLPALRTGPVRVLDRVRGRAVVGGRVGQGRVPRAGGAAAGSGTRGCPSRLRGLRMEERRHIPRAHYPVFVGDQLIGEVTSGTFSPLLQTGIALAYLWPGDVADVGDRGRGGHPRPPRGGARSCDRRSWTGARARRASSRPPARSPRRRPARTGRCGRAGRAPGATPGPSPWRP